MEKLTVMNHLDTDLGTKSTYFFGLRWAKAVLDDKLRTKSVRKRKLLLMVSKLNNHNMTTEEKNANVCHELRTEHARRSGFDCIDSYAVIGP